MSYETFQNSPAMPILYSGKAMTNIIASVSYELKPVFKIFIVATLYLGIKLSLASYPLIATSIKRM